MADLGSHMVAVKGRGAGDGSSVVNVVKPLRPRTSTRRDHEQWEEEMKEIAARIGLDSMHSKTSMPTLAISALRYPDAKGAELEQKLVELTAAWQELNTQWYHIVRPSLNLEGPFETIDRRHIKQQFIGEGVLRDGQGLYAWARSQLDEGKVQADLRKRLQMFAIAKDAN